MVIEEIKEALFYDTKKYASTLLNTIHDPIDLYNELPEDEFFTFNALTPIIDAYNTNNQILTEKHDKETLAFLSEFDERPTVSELLGKLWEDEKESLLKMFDQMIEDNNKKENINQQT